mmetsp:Transcript_18078/g.54529  ORF Transcript_18078/g.54529 Transcript_18078/m.54529 type:complete len:401 (+) Transcript_18078:229-1431(+)
MAFGQGDGLPGCGQDTAHGGCSGRRAGCQEAVEGGALHARHTGVAEVQHAEDPHPPVLHPTSRAGRPRRAFHARGAEEGGRAVVVVSDEAGQRSALAKPAEVPAEVPTEAAGRGVCTTVRAVGRRCRWRGGAPKALRLRRRGLGAAPLPGGQRHLPPHEARGDPPEWRGHTGRAPGSAQLSGPRGVRAAGGRARHAGSHEARGADGQGPLPAAPAPVCLRQPRGPLAAGPAAGVRECRAAHEAGAGAGVRAARESCARARGRGRRAGPPGRWRRGGPLQLGLAGAHKAGAARLRRRGFGGDEEAPRRGQGPIRCSAPIIRWRCQEGRPHAEHPDAHRCLRRSSRQACHGALDGPGRGGREAGPLERPRAGSGYGDRQALRGGLQAGGQARGGLGPGGHPP